MPGCGATPDGPCASSAARNLPAARPKAVDRPAAACQTCPWAWLRRREHVAGWAHPRPHLPAPRPAPPLRPHRRPHPGARLAPGARLTVALASDEIVAEPRFPEPADRPDAVRAGRFLLL